MTYRASIALILFATPALAHHEAFVITSMMPMVTGFSAMAVYGLMRWRKGRKARHKKDNGFD